MSRGKVSLVSTSAVPRLKRVERRQSKLDLILDCTAQLFNEEGIGAVSLADVAERVNISRATLYHYVNDREDLVFRCFQRSCEQTTELLTIAAENADPLEGLLGFLRDNLTVANPTAVVTDLCWMSEDGRSIIGKALRRNHMALVELLENGIEQGTIRQCNVRVVAHALTSIIAHCRMAHRWIDLSSSPLDVDALIESIRTGSAVDRRRKFVCPTDVERFSRLKAADFGPGGLTEMRVEQILMAASRMFNAQGVEGISIDDIALELGATRGTIYHYFSDKEDLVRRCADRAHQIYCDFIDYAEAHTDSSFDRLSLVGHLNSQAQAGSLQPLIMWIGLDSFSKGRRQQHIRRLRGLLRRTVKFGEDAIALGERENFDPKTLAVARAGAFSWIPRWEPPISDTDPFKVADELTALLNIGLERFDRHFQSDDR